MTATLAAPSVFDKALPSLARATKLPEAIAASAYVGEWLAVLAASPERFGECCGEMDESDGRTGEAYGVSRDVAHAPQRE